MLCSIGSQLVHHHGQRLYGLGASGRPAAAGPPDNDGSVAAKVGEFAPDGFFLMQGDKLAFSHRRLEQFQRTGKQEDFPMFEEDLSDREVERLHIIQRRVTAAIFHS